MKNSPETYRRLMKKVVQDIAALRPDSDQKLRDRLNKKFEKYAKKAGFDSQKNGTTDHTND